MAIPVRTPDIEAEIRFLTAQEGGRSTPCLSGYRPNHDFGLNGMLNDATHQYIGKESVAPGETALAHIWFLVPDYQLGMLYEGFKFTVQEGNRIVGYGFITKVLNNLLLKQ